MVERSTFRRVARLARGAIVCCGLLTGIVFASNIARASGVVALTVDQATVLRLAAPAGTIILGNPLIADASVQDSETLVLTGRSFGVTNIIVLGAGGEEILNAQLAVGGAAAAGSHVVTLHRAASRTSLSCTPECEQAPMVGDDADIFDRLASQITTRTGLSLTD